MLDERLISIITEEVVRQLQQSGYVILPERQDGIPASAPQEYEDITSAACKAKPLLKDPADPEALERMKRSTSARIGSGTETQ